MVDPVGGDARTFSVQRNPGADVNVDGYNDVIIGITGYDAISNTVTLTNTGAVAVWYGSATGMGGDETIDSADWIAEGGQVGAHLGRSLDWTGNVNGDNYAIVIAGALYYEPGVRTNAILGMRTLGYHFYCRLGIIWRIHTT